MLTFTQRLPTACDAIAPLFTLALTAEERTRSRHRFELQTQAIFLRLPRGTILQDGDRLQAKTGEIIQIAAKPEPVMTVTAETVLDLLKASYHLGNRHVPLEITPNYLRLSPDPVLKEMLQRMKVIVVEEIAVFVPEIGIYHGH
jgi:urease accessory protein